MSKRKLLSPIAKLRAELNNLLSVDENQLWRTIGTNVVNRRTQLGITQLALADMMEFSRTSVTNLERGNQHLPLAKLVRLSKFLECSLDDLLSGI